MNKIVCRIDDGADLFRKFKREKKDFNKVFLAKLWNFQKRKGLDLALDFRALKEFEKPDFDNLANVRYIFINKNNLDYFNLVKNKKKIIFSFQTDDFEKELEIVLKKQRGLSEKEWITFLKSFFVEIDIFSTDEDDIYKKVVFIRKILIKILKKDEVSKIKILLKNNFDWEFNQSLLNNKLFKIDGVVIIE